MISPSSTIPGIFTFSLKSNLNRSNRYEQPLTLLLLDLDNFKAFNDTYGHVEGAQVLRRLGQVVKRCVRDTDFAYRYGGEDFTILLPMTTNADGAITAEKIRAEFEKENFSPSPGKKCMYDDKHRGCSVQDRGRHEGIRTQVLKTSSCTRRRGTEKTELPYSEI